MRVQRTSSIVLLLAVLLLRPASAWAQGVGSGSIAGVVRDASGAVLPGVTVEAASPVLIEKVRSVVTDGQGQYKIVELRPGTYTVTVSLPGFAPFVREGLELTTGFTATVNADLKVGSIAETVTVTGASPVVDVQNVRTQTVLNREVLDALPTGKTFSSFTAMTPGVTGGASGGVATRDVGGTQGEAPLGLRAHGSDAGLTSVDGVKTISMQGGDWRRLNLSDMNSQEVVIEISGGTAEAWSGGVNINVVSKEGANKLKVNFFGAFAGEKWDANNLTSDLRARGLSSVSDHQSTYDYGIGVGGPIKKDRLWFFFTPRRWYTESEVPGNFFNKTPHTLFYNPDLSRPAIFSRKNWDASGRLTWQASEKHKIGFSSLNSYQCFCPFATEGGGVSPEGASVYLYDPERLLSLTWSNPATNRILLEGGFSWRNEGVTSARPDPSLSTAADRPVLELSINRTYGSHFASIGPTDYAVTPSHHLLGRGSLSYVTGSHAFKVGFSTLSAYEILQAEPNFPERYTFRNQLPISITQVAAPHRVESRMKMGLGVFGQDQWTMRRVTLNLGVRFDSINAYVPAQVRPAGEYLPALSFDAVESIPNWKSIHPRLGVAYDVFGNGKTAIKGQLGRYEQSGNFSLAFTRANSPVQALVVRTDRTWDDRNGNFVPDCDLHTKTANGECGPFADQAFGTTRITTRYADDVKEGWGVSPQFWQSSLSLQQELMPNVGLSVGYFRTWYTNIRVNDNLEVTGQDFDQFCITAPTDARLPNGGGYQVCGLSDVSRAKFGLSNTLVTFASDFGGRSQVFNGFDAVINARFPRGAILSGGVSAGQTTNDECASPDAVPQFCKNANPWSSRAELKLSGAYPLPWYGIQVSGVLQNLPGIPRAASYVATNAEIAPKLGRNLSSCAAATGPCNSTQTVNLYAPNTLFEPRGTQLDARVSKIFSLGAVRLRGSFDIYNLFNASDVLSLTSRYTVGPTNSWLNAVSILGGRLFKTSVQFDF